MTKVNWFLIRAIGRGARRGLWRGVTLDAFRTLEKPLPPLEEMPGARKIIESTLARYQNR